MATITDSVVTKHERKVLDRAVIRFCGDSGDGMQITGNQFTSTAALFGNDLATFPDYPAEIRAPAGTLPGVSGFQIQFSSTRRLHAGRRRGRAGGHESRRAEDEHQGSAAERHPDRQ